MCQITLNPSNSDDIRDIIRNIIEFMNGLVSCKETAEQINLSFQNLDFIHPLYSLALSAKLNQLESEGYRTNLVNLSELRCADYLKIIQFPHGMEVTNPSTLNKYQNKNYLPIIKFPASNNEEDITTRDAILSEITDLIRTNFNVTQELFNGIYYLIAELTDNINQHSEVENGWITSQFFPQKEFIDVCIADTGMGIYNTYMRQGYQFVTSHQQALENALNGLSAKGENERGRGIITSQNMIRQGLKGTFIMFSGNAMVLNNDILNIPMEWDGVLIFFRIKRNISEFNYVNYIE